MWGQIFTIFLDLLQCFLHQNFTFVQSVRALSRTTMAQAGVNRRVSLVLLF
jgi:uncharacterized protein (DUF1499 family)